MISFEFRDLMIGLETIVKRQTYENNCLKKERFNKMKSFEDYWENQLSKCHVTFVPVLNILKPFAKRIWEAALMCISKQFFWTEEYGYVIEKTSLEKELEEE